MLIQLDQYRFIKVLPSNKFKAYVVSGAITSNETKIISKHKSNALAIRAGKTFQYNARNTKTFVILDDGVAYNPEVFIGY